MTTPTEEATALYYKLRPAAIEAYDDYILTRTPATLMSVMMGLLAPDGPKVMMSNGQPVNVVSAAGAPIAGSPGVCEVQPDLTGRVKLTV